MDIKTRKLNFIQEFLRLSDEELVKKFEQMLRSERKRRLARDLKPLTIVELNEIIDKSEDDFENAKATESSEVMKIVQTWK